MTTAVDRIANQPTRTVADSERLDNVDFCAYPYIAKAPNGDLILVYHVNGVDFGVGDGAPGPRPHALGARRLRGCVFLQAADHVGHVRQLLLEVALILLEPLEDSLRLVPTTADAAAVRTSVSVMHGHLLSCS